MSLSNTNASSDSRHRGDSMHAELLGQNSIHSPQQIRSALSDAFAMDRASNQEVDLSKTINFPVDDEHCNDKPCGDQEARQPEPIHVKNSADLPEVLLSANIRLTANVLPNDNEILRKWATGLPPPKSFLEPKGTGTRFKVPSRFTSVDKVELDTFLKATMIKYDDHQYLPLTATTIYRLSPIWEEPKPVSDSEIFNCIMVNEELNAIHADHVIEALKRIGEHCHRLLILAPVSTSELGDVFNREEGNIDPGNDWDHLLSCLPNLEHLGFVDPHRGSFGESREAFNFLHAAIARQ